MKKRFILLIICFILLHSFKLQAQTENSGDLAPELSPESIGEVEAFKVGGIWIKIPLPGADLIEVGYDAREEMRTFIPDGNRLLCGYMRPDDIPLFLQVDPGLVLEQNATIQVIRNEEFNPCTTEDFNQLVAYAKTGITENDLIAPASEAELNRRLKSVNLSKLSVENPIQLGTLFSKPDAYSTCMLTAYAGNNQNRTMVVVTTFIRVRERLLFVYLITIYKNEQTVVQAEQLSEHWAEAILAENK
jgi:hypothetical protein